jgi:hypothetical protein
MYELRDNVIDLQRDWYLAASVRAVSDLLVVKLEAPDLFLPRKRGIGGGFLLSYGTRARLSAKPRA